MPIGNVRSTALLQAQSRAFNLIAEQEEEPLSPVSEASKPLAPAATAGAVTDAAPHPNRTGSMLTQLMRHGGLYTLMDQEMMTGRMTALLSKKMAQEEIASFVTTIGSKVESFFSHLVTTKDYVLDTSLISHLSFPGPGKTTGSFVGRTFTDDTQGNPTMLESKTIPAAFTFVGQFVDHDLTMNAVDLFTDQTGPVMDTASPFIDLDSVYGPRTTLFNKPLHGSIYNKDGTFKLVSKSGAHGPYFDLPRDKKHKAYISDARNDENQMILQIHLLIMRLHNKLISTVYRNMPLEKAFAAAYKETLYNWQSVLLDEYLPFILYEAAGYSTLDFLRGELKKPRFGAFKYKPCLDLSTERYVASLPHEFAIGFRFGHSQLKPGYMLQASGGTVPLFDNSLTPDAKGNTADLRGSQPLIPDHVIEWPFFAGAFYSNLIDGRVTSKVFDLPESTIPDDIKFVGNLIQRNLIRSSQVGLCSGEELAKFYKIPALTPAEIDPDPSTWHLYGAKDTNGHGKGFKTPVWYYFLKEAERDGQARGSLGKLGSRLIGEVILGAIAWGEFSVLNEPGWTSQIPLKTAGKVTLLDIAAFV